MSDALAVFKPLAEALDYAHHHKVISSEGVIHRDIKPSNVMVANGVPYLIDFGLAAQIRESTTKLSSTTRLSNAVTDQVGTPVYEAPEQWMGKRQTARTDQYALGVMLYEFLGGNPPFYSYGKDWIERMAKLRFMVLNDEMPRLKGFSEAVNSILAKALAKDRRKRWGCCIEFINALSKLAAERKAGDLHRFELKGVEWRFRWCPAGSFMMGRSSSEKTDYSDAISQHKVTLTHGFWMARTQVTQAMWESVMRSNPSRFKGDNLPVECVSWEDCQEFVKKLNELVVTSGAGKSYRFSLPTEAQWEYACRAGSTSAYCFGDSVDFLSDYAWYKEHSDGVTHPVGLKKPNAWRLYDMHGNVWEWCQDWHGAYSVGAVTDPVGASSGSARVIRGGSRNNDAQHCRSANRSHNSPENQNSLLGLRVCLVPNK